MREENRVAVVTGASRGIGRAIATTFSRGGLKVVLAARDEAAITSLAEQFWRHGRVALSVPTDVRKRSDCERLITTTVERMGRLDVLVNNAGIGAFAPVAALEEDQLRNVIETNLYSLFFLCRAAVLQMRSQPEGGHIVNIGSLASKNTFAGGAAYCASKFGLLAMSECLMLEERYNNVRVTAVLPGSVNTSFAGEADASWKVPADDVAQAVWDVVSSNHASLTSLVEIRPLRPPRK
ncbi:MAG: SDR family NAD(P)-dependent oxidoreductase [Acidobacteriota bacterium]